MHESNSTLTKPRTLDEHVADATRQKLEHWLGECRTEPRDLHEYDDLPCIPRRKTLPTESPCPENLRGEPANASWPSGPI